MSKSPVALIILDGFGCRNEEKGNAVFHAKTELRPLLGSVSAFPFNCKRRSGRLACRSNGELGSGPFEYRGRTDRLSKPDPCEPGNP